MADVTHEQARQRLAECVFGRLSPKEFDALIAALTRPAPQPSEGELVGKMQHSSDDARKFIIETIRENFDKAPDLGDASYPAFESEWNDGAEEIADLILARLAARVPEGWQLVPETPTKEMMKAASDIATKSAAENYGGAPSGDDYWYAMLAAAPAPEVKK